MNTIILLDGFSPRLKELFLSLSFVSQSDQNTVISSPRLMRSSSDLNYFDKGDNLSDQLIRQVDFALENNKKHVFIDHYFLSDEKRKPFLDYADEKGLKVDIIWFETSKNRYLRDNIEFFRDQFDPALITNYIHKLEKEFDIPHSLSSKDNIEVSSITEGDLIKLANEFKDFSETIRN